ncbi:MAG: pentapeptide repeat-containing protein [Pseudomonadota bacterium]|jgi:uncharacterized protein YjbI with pentapeptide repeats|nr:pentapeptide repeat-containing protein [Pseudomonadota bacterium]MED5423172.1 pentapeptide repeat-containing protein [Pseudomonadota bacterium]MEE3322922.1 pentapeptide repeat-containing protein [Pseudomonadota bacterium]
MSRLEKPELFRLTNRDGITIYQCRVNNLKQALEMAVAEGVKLHNLDLSYQDLSFVNLDDAHLYDVSFAGANMIGANLSEAMIQKCDFTEASLLGACLAYSIISQTCFVNTEFAGVDISCARFFYNKFIGGNVFFLDFSSADKFVGTHLYDDKREKFMDLQQYCIRLSMNGKHYIINDMDVYVRGEICQMHHKCNDFFE